MAPAAWTDRDSSLDNTRHGAKLWGWPFNRGRRSVWPLRAREERQFLPGRGGQVSFLYN